MGLEAHKERAPKVVGVQVVTVSDTRSRNGDTGGNLVCQYLEEAGHHVVDRFIIKDDHLDIESSIIRGMQNPEVAVIIFTGGTGISGRDVTPDVVEEHLDKALDGFGEIFRYLSYKEIGPAAILSRALCGVSDGRIIISLPGSPAAVRLAMEKLIVPEIGHMVGEATKA